MKDSPRYAALELAVAFANPRLPVTAEDVVGAANVFHNFLTEAVAPEAPAAPAKPVKAAATKAADKAPPAAEPKAEAAAETPAEKPAATKATKVEPEVTAADCSKAVVKLVTKVGRDPAVQWMQKTFGSPNVSGLDLTKHSYPAVIKKILAHIAELEKPAETETSPAD